MDYLLLFLEGVITFISPCLLPMIPIYVMYFAGGEESNRKKTLMNASAFVLGFTVVFVTLGAFAGTLGALLVQYRTVVNIVAGLIVVLFGLNYMGVFKFGFLHHGGSNKSVKINGVVSAFVFGLVFSVNWTPCVGTFLGTALMQASVKGSVGHGVLLLLCYSIGLGIPFILSAVLVSRLKGAFDFMKKHHTVISRVAGGLLVVMGVFIATGLFGRFMTLLD